MWGANEQSSGPIPATAGRTFKYDAGTSPPVTDRTGSDDGARGILLGRESGAGPTAQLGACVARDGSTGAEVRLDLDRPS